MSVDVFTEIVIERPRAEVASFASNPDNDPAWYVNIKSVEWESQPPLRVGSGVSFVAHFLGKRLTYTYEAIEFVPHERLIIRDTQAPLPKEIPDTWQGRSRRGTVIGF